MFLQVEGGWGGEGSRCLRGWLQRQFEMMLVIYLLTILLFIIILLLLRAQLQLMKEYKYSLQNKQKIFQKDLLHQNQRKFDSFENIIEIFKIIKFITRLALRQSHEISSCLQQMNMKFEQICLKILNSNNLIGSDLMAAISLYIYNLNHFIILNFKFQIFKSKYLFIQLKEMPHGITTSIENYQVIFNIQIIEIGPLLYFFYNRKLIRGIRREGMNIASKLKQAVKMGDFFNTSQMLRFDSENDYRTITGGFISIGIIITIIIAFASMIQDTINRTLITYSRTLQKNGEPPLSNLITSPEKNFMFAVRVDGYNLSSESRIFDVLIYQMQSFNMSQQAMTSINLETCTKEHWAMLPEVINKWDKLGGSNWLCPEIGTAMKIAGKYSTNYSSMLYISLWACSNDTDPNRPCGSYEQFNSFIENRAYMNLFTFYYVNSIINADQPQYKSYYLEDRSYVTFGVNMGNQYYMYLREINIETDVSIWPFQSIQKDSAYYIEYAPILYPFQVNPNRTALAIMKIMADYSKQSYSRQVQKIFVVFSFIGGLVGAILASLFIVNSYTAFAFQMTLSFSLFRDKERQHQQNKEQKHRQLQTKSKKSANILHFLQFQIFSIFQRLNPNLKWPLIQYMQQCRQEILVQLDINKLIKRVIFLQYAISDLIDEYRLAQLQKNRPILPSEIKMLRQKLQAKQIQRTELFTKKSQKMKTLMDIPVDFELQPDIELNMVGTISRNERKAGMRKYSAEMQRVDENQELKQKQGYMESIRVDVENSGNNLNEYPQKNIKIKQTLQKKESNRRSQLLQIIKLPSKILDRVIQSRK